MPSEQIESTLLDESHREVDLFGPIDRRFEIGQKRIEFASCEVARCTGTVDRFVDEVVGRIFG